MDSLAVIGILFSLYLAVLGIETDFVARKFPNKIMVTGLVSALLIAIIRALWFQTWAPVNGFAAGVTFFTLMCGWMSYSKVIGPGDAKAGIALSGFFGQSGLLEQFTILVLLCGAVWIGAWFWLEKKGRLPKSQRNRGCPFMLAFFLAGLIAFLSYLYTYI